jgi:hypothetical protein
MTTNKESKSKEATRRRLRIDPSFIDVNARVSDEVWVTRETLSLLRTLPFEEAGKLLGNIITAAEHDGAIPEGPKEKRTRRAHERACKVEAGEPPEYGTSEATNYQRDLKTLGASRPVGRPSGPRKTR